MACGVFASANVKVNLLPVAGCFLWCKFVLIFCIHVSQVIPRASGPTGHGGMLIVKLAFMFPILRPRQWRFSAFSRQILVYFGQYNGQIVFIHRFRNSILIVYRYGFSPVTLSSENGIAQTVIHFSFSKSALFNFSNNFFDGLFYFKPVNQLRVDALAIVRIKTFFIGQSRVVWLYYFFDRQVKMLGKSIITRIMCRYTHHSACSVSG